MIEPRAIGQPITSGVSRAKDSATAAMEFYRSVWHADLESVLFFCSPQYDLELL